jgi:hypothetical protein
MSDFEREIVQCFNRFFRARQIQGFAFRVRPKKSAGRCMGILVDSPDPAYNLSIECKSIVDKKLYFSQHFHTDRNDIHRIDELSDLLTKNRRTGFLAIEFRQGPGKASEAYLIPWESVVGYFRNNKGISIEEARAFISLARSKDGYVLETL